MTTSINKPIPVFLPGSHKEWDEVAGIARISEDGEINIKLHSKDMALDLVQNWVKNGKIMSISMDYIKRGL